jgi:hypothetical protein
VSACRLRPAPMLLRAALLIVVALVTPAAVAQEAALPVLPIEPLLAAPVALDVTGAGTAVLSITTTVDLACVVVYGPDDGFGSLAVDVDMGASAHRDHLVMLRDLEPDTEYHYRLQGSDPDGNLYASETLRFRTPPRASPEAGWTNVARVDLGARVVEVSSEFGAAFAAVHAIDGDARSEWSSRGDGDEAFITIELPSSVEFVGFGLWTRTMGASAQISSFEVVTEQGEAFGPFEIADAAALHRFDAEGRGQRFTFRVVASSGGNTGAVEVAVFVADGD